MQVLQAAFALAAGPGVDDVVRVGAAWVVYASINFGIRSLRLLLLMFSLGGLCLLIHVLDRLVDDTQVHHYCVLYVFLVL